MRDAFISIFFIFTLAASVKSTDKDGFNYYKDYLRGRSDEVNPDATTAERMLYFYRTPVQLYPGLLPALERELYRKRTGNAFKSHMMSKELLSDGEDTSKRSSKTALSLMLQGKNAQEFQKILDEIKLPQIRV